MTANLEELIKPNTITDANEQDADVDVRQKKKKRARKFKERDEAARRSGESRIGSR